MGRRPTARSSHRGQDYRDHIRSIATQLRDMTLRGKIIEVITRWAAVQQRDLAMGAKIIEAISRWAAIQLRELAVGEEIAAATMKPLD